MSRKFQVKDVFWQLEYLSKLTGIKPDKQTLSYFYQIFPKVNLEQRSRNISLFEDFDGFFVILNPLLRQKYISKTIGGLKKVLKERQISFTDAMPTDRVRMGSATEVAYTKIATDYKQSGNYWLLPMSFGDLSIPIFERDLVIDEPKKSIHSLSYFNITAIAGVCALITHFDEIMTAARGEVNLYFSGEEYLQEDRNPRIPVLSVNVENFDAIFGSVQSTQADDGNHVSAYMIEEK